MDEYRQLLTDARNRRRELTDKRNSLVKQVEEIDRQILGLNQAVEGYEFILGETSPVIPMVSVDRATVGFTEAIRKIFNASGISPLFPTDIRDRLSKAGYENTSEKVLLIHVHNVIDRLLKSEEIERVEIDGRSAYRRRSNYAMDPVPPPPFGILGEEAPAPSKAFGGKGLMEALKQAGRDKK
jgi:hypothetical protein